MNRELCEYRVEFKESDSSKWSPLGSETTDVKDAKRQLAMNRLAFPRFQYRLAMRTVSPWCECVESKTEEGK